MIKSIFSRINKIVSDVIFKLRHREPWYKYYDKGGKIKYPDLTIYELIEKTARTYPNNFAMEYSPQTPHQKPIQPLKKQGFFSFSLSPNALLLLL